MSELLDYADRLWRGEATTEAYHSGEFRKSRLHEVAESAPMWPASSDVHVFPTEHGLVLLDTGDRRTAGRRFDAVRSRTYTPLHTAIYSHGHTDHVFGLGPFDAEATERGLRHPNVVAHEAVPNRFARDAVTNGYNQ